MGRISAAGVRAGEALLNVHMVERIKACQTAGHSIGKVW
jgi:hypothetical protein